MSLKQATKRGSKARARRSLRKYRNLPNGATFHFPNDSRRFVKICDAFSISDDNEGKDIIPNLFQQVVFCGLKEGYYPLFNA